MLLVASCGSKSSKGSDDSQNGESPDLAEIEIAGELIAVTVNGPQTLYEYRGRNTGLQFVMAEMFANRLGLRLRIEVASDTAEMIKMLKDEEVDLIACPLANDMLEEEGLEPCGVVVGDSSWAVRKTSPQLMEELNSWYDADTRSLAQEEMKNIESGGFKKITSYAVFQSKSEGIVSNYDPLFLRASRECGWDWKLIASMCYQESSFDANAVSWAGATGLMQIMPSTAKGYGVDPEALYDPETNIMTASKIIRKTEGYFSNIGNTTERKKFVLGAYNGGTGHIQDAMALARKDGKNPYLWDDVSYYVLHLSEPQYYNDPVVKHGYMIGKETFNYVNNVMGRWNGYHSVLHDAMPKRTTYVPATNNSVNTTTTVSAGGKGTPVVPKKTKQPIRNIISKDDSLFAIDR